MTAVLDHDDLVVKVLEPGQHLSEQLGPVVARDCGGHGATPTTDSPSVSGQPSARFIDCTAAPAAPLTRLSIAQTATSFAASWSTATASCATLLPTTAPVRGSTPSGSRCTKGSPL